MSKLLSYRCSLSSPALYLAPARFYNGSLPAHGDNLVNTTNGNYSIELDSELVFVSTLVLVYTVLISWCTLCT